MQLEGNFASARSCTESKFNCIILSNDFNEGISSIIQTVHAQYMMVGG